MVYKILFGFLVLVSNLFASINLEDLKTFKADFTQIVMNESKKSVEYTGKVFIRSDSKVLWEYKTPIIKNVYIIDETVIVDEPELEQAIYTTLEKEINILKLLKDAEKIDNNLYKTRLYEVDYFITLKDDKIKSLSYKDELANRISIVFSNSVNNSEIENSYFQFLAPDFYDVIKK